MTVFILQMINETTPFHSITVHATRESAERMAAENDWISERSVIIETEVLTN